MLKQIRPPENYNEMQQIDRTDLTKTKLVNKNKKKIETKRNET